jgi:hypothetical protein
MSMFWVKPWECFEASWLLDKGENIKQPYQIKLCGVAPQRKKVHNSVIREVRKTQHQNLEFGHTQGEIQKKACKKVQ